MAIWLFLLLAVPCVGQDSDVTDSEQQRKSYEGYKILSVTAESKETVDTLMDYVLQRVDLEILNHRIFLGRNVNILTSPNQLGGLIQFLNDTAIPFTISVENLQEQIDQEREENEQRTLPKVKAQFRSGKLRRSGAEINFETYQDFRGIESSLRRLVNEHPEKAQLTVIGGSTHSRPVYLIKVGMKSDVTKPGLFVNGGIHGREWISPTAILYSINKLLKDEALLKKITFHFVPVSNPDGFDYTHHGMKNGRADPTRRMWRKTASGPRCSGYECCMGVDGNRNYPFMFKYNPYAQSARNPCSDTYAGEQPLSEPETRAISQYLLTNKQRLQGFVDVHAYGRMVLYPYGYASQGMQMPENIDELKAVGARMKQAMSAVNGSDFKCMNSAAGTQPAPGASEDYAKHLGIRFAYCVELAPGSSATGRSGFILDPKDIKVASEELLAGLKTLAHAIVETEVEEKH